MSNCLLFFDTDCIASFLWVNRENLLVQLYPALIVLPKHVFDELSHPSVPQLKRKLHALLCSGDIVTMTIEANTAEYTLYCQLAVRPPAGHKPIGRGEAAAIALAKARNGILASNNIQDVSPYVTQYGIQHITTGDILVQSLQEGIIDETVGNVIWQAMLHKCRKLPAATFTDYLKAL